MQSYNQRPAQLDSEGRLRAMEEAAAAPAAGQPLAKPKLTASPVQIGQAELSRWRAPLSVVTEGACEGRASGAQREQPHLRQVLDHSLSSIRRPRFHMFADSAPHRLNWRQTAVITQFLGALPPLAVSLRGGDPSQGVRRRRVSCMADFWVFHAPIGFPVTMGIVRCWLAA
jgi:hypothetical protein